MGTIRTSFTFLSVMLVGTLILACKKPQELTPKFIRPSVTAQSQAPQAYVDKEYAIDIKNLGKSQERPWCSFIYVESVNIKGFTFNLLHADIVYDLDSFPIYIYDLGEFSIKAYSTTKAAVTPLILCYKNKEELVNFTIIIRQGGEEDFNIPYIYQGKEKVEVLDSYVDTSSAIHYQVALVAHKESNKIKATIKPKGDTMRVTISLL